MPKKYGVKEKDLVVSHVVNLVLTGKLRSGDRIDRNEIANDLGLSRVPIQEAVVQLEHDGILSTRYHRGAYVERFDESVVREHHEVYGLLSGVASARAAVDGVPRILDQLSLLIEAMRSNNESRAFQEMAWQFRRVSTTNTPAHDCRPRSVRRRPSCRGGSGWPTSRTTTRCCRSTRPSPPPSTGATRIVLAWCALSGPRRWPGSCSVNWCGGGCSNLPVPPGRRHPARVRRQLRSDLAEAGGGSPTSSR